MDDKKRYPNTYRWWSNAETADSAVNFLIEMNWKSVAVIFDSGDYSLKVSFFFGKICNEVLKVITRLLIDSFRHLLITTSPLKLWKCLSLIQQKL